MAVARVLDTVRTPLYRGQFERLTADHDLGLRLRERYREAYRTAAGNGRVARAGEATAAFSISTYPEHHVPNAVQGAARPVVAGMPGELEPDDVFRDIGASSGAYDHGVPRVVDR